MQLPDCRDPKKALCHWVNAHVCNVLAIHVAIIIIIIIIIMLIINEPMCDRTNKTSSSTVNYPAIYSSLFRVLFPPAHLTKSHRV